MKGDYFPGIREPRLTMYSDGTVYMTRARCNEPDNTKADEYAVLGEREEIVWIPCSEGTSFKEMKPFLSRDPDAPGWVLPPAHYVDMTLAEAEEAYKKRCAERGFPCED